MDLTALWAALEALPLATAIREGESLFPWIETVHVLAIVLVVGTIGIVDLRLIGVRAHIPQVGALIRQLLPVTWAAFATAAVSGLLMFVSNAATYAANGPFRLKLVLLVLAGLNMAAFHLITQRRLVDWDEAPTPPASAKLAGLVSLTVWILVIFAGRWIGFTLV